MWSAVLGKRIELILPDATQAVLDREIELPKGQDDVVSESRALVGAPTLSRGQLRLDQLPGAIADLDLMPLDLKKANMRLLRIASLLQWASLKVYEDVVASDCLQLPYSSVSEQQWAATLVLSWRWGKPKPMPDPVPGYSPMAPAQWSELCHLLANAVGNGIEFAWVDWSCVPQYSSDGAAGSMVEVLRSKVYYARAASMVILTTFEELPGSGSVQLILGRAHRELQGLSAQDPSGKFVEQLVAVALRAMLDKGYVANREYFGRAWTLAERGERDDVILLSTRPTTCVLVVDPCSREVRAQGGPPPLDIPRGLAGNGGRRHAQE